MLTPFYFEVILDLQREVYLSPGYSNVNTLC